MRTTSRFPFVVAILSTLAGCVSDRTVHKDVPLVWLVGQESAVAVAAGVAPIRIRVEPLLDRRQDPKVIGMNVKNAASPLPVTTRDDVAAWSTDRFKHVLARQGFEIVESGEEIILDVEILKLVVIEAGMFNGSAEFGVQASDANGRLIWRGTLAGKSKRWGRTNNLDNYYEALQNAFESAASKLGETPGFMDALWARSR